MMHLLVIAFFLLAIAHPVIGAEPPLYDVNKEDLKCLTDNIYYESRGEPYVGQALVAGVVLNRVKDDRWKDTVCGVVYQPHQFSWTDENHTTIGDIKAYNMAQSISFVLLQSRDTGDSGVNHYLRCDWRNKVSWWKSMKFLGQVGNHCFYKG